MNIKQANEKFEQWRKEQIASLIRTGHLEAAKAFEQLGSIHWMAWQSAWTLSRESLVDNGRLLMDGRRSNRRKGRNFLRRPIELASWLLT